MNYEKFKPTTNPDQVLNQLQQTTNAQIQAEQIKTQQKINNREGLVNSFSDLAKAGTKARKIIEQQEENELKLQAQENEAKLSKEANAIAIDESKSIEQRQIEQRQLYEQAQSKLKQDKQQAEKSDWWYSPEGKMRKASFLQSLETANQQSIDTYSANLAKLEQEKQVELLKNTKFNIEAQQNFKDAQKSFLESESIIRQSNNISPAQKEQLIQQNRNELYSTNQVIRFKEGDELENRMDETAINYYNREIKILENQKDNPYGNRHIYELQSKRDAYEKRLNATKGSQAVIVHTDFTSKTFLDSLEGENGLKNSSWYKNATPEEKTAAVQEFFSANKKYLEDPTTYELNRTPEYGENRLALVRKFSDNGKSFSALSKPEQTSINKALKESLSEKEINGQFEIIENIFQGNKQVAISEAKKALPAGLDQMLAESFFNRDIETYNKLLSVKIAKNKNGGELPITGKDKYDKPDIDFTKSSTKANYLARLDMKESKAYIEAVGDYMKYYKKTNNEAEAELNGNKIKYITDPNILVGIDITKGVSETSVKNYLNNEIRNPVKSLDRRQSPRDFINTRGNLNDPNTRIYDIDDTWIAIEMQDPITGQRNTTRYLNKEEMYFDILNENRKKDTLTKVVQSNKELVEKYAK